MRSRSHTKRGPGRMPYSKLTPRERAVADEQDFIRRYLNRGGRGWNPHVRVL